MYGYGHMGWMGLWWLVGLIIVIGVVWMIARSGAGRSAAEDSPETILKRRYARGEIDKEEYQRRLEDLRK